MWYSLKSITSSTLHPSDWAMLVAYANLLRHYGYSYSLMELEAILSDGNTSPINWQSANLVPGLRLSQDSELGGWPLDNPAIVVFDIDGQSLPCFAIDVNQRLVVDSSTGEVVSASKEYGKPVGWAAFYPPKPPVQLDPPKEPMLYKTNVVDGITYDSYGTPKHMWVKTVEGADLMEYGGSIANFRDFIPVPGKHLAYGSEVRIMGVAHHPVKPLGNDFLVPMEPFDSWGEFTRTGRPAAHQGFKLKDLSNTPPPALKPRPVATIAPKVKPPTDFHFKYLRDDHQPVYYQVRRRTISSSFVDPSRPHIVVAPGTLDQPQRIKVLGTFWVNGQQLLLPVLSGGADPFEWYYGVQETDDIGNRYVEKIPDADDFPDDGIVTADEKPRRHGLDEHIVNISTFLEIGAIAAVVKLKYHIGRIRQWKK